MSLNFFSSQITTRTYNDATVAQCTLTQPFHQKKPTADMFTIFRAYYMGYIISNIKSETEI